MPVSTIAASSVVIHTPSTATRHMPLANHRPATRSYELILVVNGKTERRELRGVSPHELVKACRRVLQDIGRGCLLAYDMATGNLVFEA